MSTWQVLPLWGAILLNVILRARQWQVPSKRGTRVASDSNQGLSDSTTMMKRIQQLEEDFQNTVTTSRVLSRHLEKLGVRFRVTRRSLRDPIQEASYTRMLCDIEPLPLVIIVMCLRHLDECLNEDTIDTL